MISYASKHDACLALQHQALFTLQFAQQEQIRLKDLPHLDSADLIQHELRWISPEQYLNALQELQRGVATAHKEELSFLLGSQLLPGQVGAASNALLHAQNLRQALACLVQFQSVLCPLLTPRLKIQEHHTILYWMDAWGRPSALPFLVEMHMSAVTAMCHWLSGVRLPWTFCFNRNPPRHIEQHHVYLGSQLRFNCYIDAMIIQNDHLDQAWPRANNFAFQRAHHLAQNELEAMPLAESLLKSVYDFLILHIQEQPTLDKTAQAFNCSSATLKRHLAEHGSHFQAELDQARTHMALYLFHTQGYDNEAVARYLGFHDATNFRRSFKRWTGVTPSFLKQALDPLDWMFTTNNTNNWNIS